MSPCMYCGAPLAECEADPCPTRKARNEAEVVTLDNLKPGFTSWRLTRPDGSETSLAVAPRTQEQKERSKQNVENPAPPSGFKRHGQLDSLR